VVVRARASWMSPLAFGSLRGTMGVRWLVARLKNGTRGAESGFVAGEGRVAKRHKWRLACEIVSEGRSQRAIVIDLSETGLFAQTSTRLPPGSVVEVRVRLTESAEPIQLRAQVARNKQVPPQLTSVARGGIGLRLLDAPAAYFEQIHALDGSGDGKRATTAATAPTPMKAPAGIRFRVRVKQSDGPRSRSLEIVATSADEARARALADVGNGWEAVAAEAIG
jgi:hypothetical protein